MAERNPRVGLVSHDAFRDSSARYANVRIAHLPGEVHVLVLIVVEQVREGNAAHPKEVIDRESARHDEGDAVHVFSEEDDAQWKPWRARGRPREYPRWSYPRKGFHCDDAPASIPLLNDPRTQAYTGAVCVCAPELFHLRICEQRSDRGGHGHREYIRAPM